MNPTNHMTPLMTPLMSPASQKPHSDFADPADPSAAQDEHAAPGGVAINHAATVVTSAALGGVVAGALVGSMAGPIGTAVGAAIGALAAGGAGHAVAASVDAQAEEDHHRAQDASPGSLASDRGYVDDGRDTRVVHDAHDAHEAPEARHAREALHAFDAQDAFETNTRAGSFDVVDDPKRGASILEWDRATPASPTTPTSTPTTREAWWRAGGGPERD